MKQRSNALLVELLIVIMFFMLASTLLMEVYAKSHSLSMKAEAIAEAVVDVQNVADSLYLSEEPDQLLASMGFVEQDGVYVLPRDSYEMRVTVGEEALATGTMHLREVQVIYENEPMITLPVNHFEEAIEP